MSEAIIARGGKQGSGGGIQFEPSTSYIYENGFYTAYPGNYRVICVGGGGYGGEGRTGSRLFSGGGGGSGYVNEYSFYKNALSQVPVTIGSGGSPTSTTGGTTSFGTYVSAAGGSTGSKPDAYNLIVAIGGAGLNSGQNGKSTQNKNSWSAAIGGYGGWLYTDSDVTNVYGTPVYSNRLYYGDGGNGQSASNTSGLYGRGNGNNGCIIVIYTP